MNPNWTNIVTYAAIFVYLLAFWAFVWWVVT